MSKYTVILSYGQHSDPEAAHIETFLCEVDSRIEGYGGPEEAKKAIALACGKIRHQNGWRKRTHPDSDFPPLYVFYGRVTCIQSQMD